MKSYAISGPLETRANDAVFVPAERKCGCSHPGSYPISFCTLRLKECIIYIKREKGNIRERIERSEERAKGKRERKEEREARRERAKERS
jgi:hypothetical protein